MAKARQAITEGLALRAQAGIKVRQPLASVELPELPEMYKEIISEELNVKEVKWGNELQLDTTMTPVLRSEGLIREVIRQVQSARKAADLQVDDRISLVLSTDDKELERAIHEHADIIKTETLATHLAKEGSGAFEVTAKVEGADLVVKLQKS
jgi:isoleucyl-tRNA synthetase